MPAGRDVVVTGIGAVTPIGNGVEQLVESVRANRSGIGLWQSGQMGKALPAAMIAEQFEHLFTKMELPYLDRCSQIAMVAAEQAVLDAGIERFDLLGQRAGIFFGSVAGGVKTEHEWVRQFELEGKRLARPYTIMASMLNAAPAQISIRHKVLGPVMTHSNACTSSGAAIGDALRAIRHGYLDVAIAGGADASLIPTFMALWGGLRALADPDPVDVARSSRPFSRDRAGVVLGEGAVFLILEARESAAARGARAYCRLSGYGIASDGYHIGSPSASGQVAALNDALSDASLRADDIAYVNAHATATPGGDVVEANAIAAVLGDRVPVSSTKAIHGHLLGAASAIELAITALAVHRSFLPATAFLDDPDPACALNHVARDSRPGQPLAHALSLSAGFGGTNVALIVSAENEASRK
jgi:3-oxoacyl-(acyl-carrier-protein) synthase